MGLGAEKENRRADPPAILNLGDPSPKGRMAFGKKETRTKGRRSESQEWNLTTVAKLLRFPLQMPQLKEGISPHRNRHPFTYSGQTPFQVYR